jgi:hypothetical protein
MTFNEDKMEKEFKIINSTLKEIRDRVDVTIGNTASLIDRIIYIESQVRKQAGEAI